MFHLGNDFGAKYLGQPYRCRIIRKDPRLYLAVAAFEKNLYRPEPDRAADGRSLMRARDHQAVDERLAIEDQPFAVPNQAIVVPCQDITTCVHSGPRLPQSFQIDRLHDARRAIRTVVKIDNGSVDILIAAGITLQTRRAWINDSYKFAVAP
jgi:hypothetical protein